MDNKTQTKQPFVSRYKKPKIDFKKLSEQEAFSLSRNWESSARSLETKLFFSKDGSPEQTLLFNTLNSFWKKIAALEKVRRNFINKNKKG